MQNMLYFLDRTTYTAIIIIIGKLIEFLCINLHFFFYIYLLETKHRCTRMQGCIKKKIRQWYNDKLEMIKELKIIE